MPCHYYNTILHMNSMSDLVDANIVIDNEVTVFLYTIYVCIRYKKNNSTNHAFVVFLIKKMGGDVYLSKYFKSIYLNCIQCR